MDRTGRPGADPKRAAESQGLVGNSISMCRLRRPNSRRKHGTTIFEISAISSTLASSVGIPLSPVKTSEIRRALVRSPQESGCTASSSIFSSNWDKNREKPAWRKSRPIAPEPSSRCSQCAKIRSASFDVMRGIVCLSRLRFPTVVSGIKILVSRRPGWFRVVRPRELPELWTAHYKGEQICGLCGLRPDPDNTTVRRG